MVITYMVGMHMLQVYRKQQLEDNIDLKDRWQGMDKNFPFLFLSSLEPQSCILVEKKKQLGDGSEQICSYLWPHFCKK